MRACPLCGEQMQQSNVDEFPSDIWECPICGHAEENLEAEDFDPDGEYKKYKMTDDELDAEGDE
jgi:rRNA maturation protein Nop10